MISSGEYVFPLLDSYLFNVSLASEFNYVKNENNECVLVPGTTPLPNDDSCNNFEEFWYERMEYRKIPYLSCDDGL